MNLVLGKPQHDDEEPRYPTTPRDEDYPPDYDADWAAREYFRRHHPYGPKEDA